MTPPAIFGISVLFGFIVWGIVGTRYIWPALTSRPRVEAIRVVLLLHAFRFVGLAFRVPGVVSPSLPLDFARPAAYGDFLTAVIALLAFVLLPNALGFALVWLFNVVGTVDLLYAFYQGNATGLEPGAQGAMYFVPTVVVPLLLVTHALMFRLLLRRNGTTA